MDNDEIKALYEKEVGHPFQRTPTEPLQSLFSWEVPAIVITVLMVIRLAIMLLTGV